MRIAPRSIQCRGQSRPRKGADVKKPPCIRNLPAFAEGCPRRPYDDVTGEGCPAWVEKVAPTTGKPLEKDNHRMCLDNWMMKLAWDLQGKVEGQLAAIETLILKA